MYIFCAKTNGISGSVRVRELLDCAFYSIYGVHAPEIAKTRFGKPYFPEAPDIFFSLSHTNDYVLCAIDNSPIGADIESTGRRVSDALVRRVCSENELSEFSFMELWTLKESFIKLKGNILTMPNKRICFSRLPDGLAVSVEQDVYGKSYMDIPGFTVSVCSPGTLFPDKIQML